jgi:hypothetical protein
VQKPVGLALPPPGSGGMAISPLGQAALLASQTGAPDPNMANASTKPQLPLPPAGGPSGGMPMVVPPVAPTGAPIMMKKGGKVKAKAPVKKMASGGKVSSASSRGDGCCVKGKTKGRYI